MNLNTALMGEFGIACAINSWGALKQGQMPFPGAIARSGVAFGVLGVVGMWQPQLAGMLGAGFLLALIIKQASSGWSSFGAVDPDSTYTYLTFSQTIAGNASAAPAAGN